MKTVNIILTPESAQRAKDHLVDALGSAGVETDSVIHALKRGIEHPGETIVEQKWDDKRGWIGLE